jgi:alkylhydroperoxidase/carboxymuconolactone decarboxylase family protein YurZ
MTDLFRDKISGFLDRPGLDRSTRHLCWITSILSIGDEASLKDAILTGLDDSVSPMLIREAILQSYLFIGYPKVINGLFLLKDVCARLGLDYPDEAKPREDYSNWSVWEDRGEDLCRKVYGSSYDALQERIKAIHPHLARWMIVEGYGKVLGHEGLATDLREMMVISVLVSQGSWRQLRSHLIGGIHLGISHVQLREIVFQLERIIPADQLRKALDLLDELVDQEDLC